MKTAILVLSLALGTYAFADQAMKDQMQAARAEENAKVKAACSAEIAASGCTEDLGKGLMKCVHEYHQAHKDMKVSEGCHSVVKDTREVRHERREHRKEMRAERKASKGGATPASPSSP